MGPPYAQTLMCCCACVRARAPGAQCSLAYKKLGISPIVMSAGELESGNAGEPAKLIRQRYREASDIIKKGKMCSLFINDLDAGAGRMGEGTQYTVNNQMVRGREI